MRAVNLLPHDEQRPRLAGGRAPLLVAVAGVVLVTVGALLLGMSASSTTDSRRAELESLQAQIDRMSKTSEPAVSSGVISQERTDRFAALSAALANRFSFDRFLGQIALVLPEDAWLTGLKAAVPESAAPAATGSGAPRPPATPTTTTEGVTIEGATYSQGSVARVLSRLALVPGLQDVRLTASALVDPAADSQVSAGSGSGAKRHKKVVTFTISASLQTEAS